MMIKAGKEDVTRSIQHLQYLHGKQNPAGVCVLGKRWNNRIVEGINATRRTVMMVLRE